MRTAMILGSAAVAIFAFGLLSQGILPVPGMATHPSAVGIHPPLAPTRNLEKHGATSLPNPGHAQFAGASGMSGSHAPETSSVPTQVAGNPAMTPVGSMMGSTHCVMHEKMNSVNLTLH